MTPSDTYLFLPDEAKPLAPRVSVEGERDGGPGGIFFVDVVVRKASLLERFVPPTRPDGSTSVPEHALLPPGTSESQRREQSRREMTRSQNIAAAVALRELGHDVDARATGAIVEGVAPDAPAVGKLQPTDVIVAVDGTRVRTTSDLRRLIRRHEPGDTLTLKVRRGGDEIDVEVGTRADPNDGGTIVGIAVGQDAQVELPFDVDIDLGAVGGPSAGVAFALDVMEELGANVDRGHRVAATGELELDGTILSVGGVQQKTIGARRAGIDVFVVPAGDNERTARRFAGGMQVLAVKNFQQALRKLATLPRKA